MRFSRVTLTASLLASMATPYVRSPLHAQTERRTVSGDRVAIYNLAGKLRVESGDGPEVVVEITRNGRDADRLRIEEGAIRGYETVRVLYPADRIVYSESGRNDHTTLNVRDDGTWGDNPGNGEGQRRHSSDREGNRVEIASSGSGLEAYADIRVLVPRGQRIIIHQAVGDTRITMVDADLALDVASSTVTAERTRGHLSLDTGSGSVTVSGIKGESLRMDTGSGSIHGSDVDVTQLKADVGSGGVRLERVRATQVEVDAGSGGTELELLSPIEHLKVDAGSGGVTIRLPASQGADVDIETGSGGIDTDFAVQVTRFEQRHMVGRIGNGRGRIRIESGSGQVHLLKG